MRVGCSGNSFPWTLVEPNRSQTLEKEGQRYPQNITSNKHYTALIFLRGGHILQKQMALSIPFITTFNQFDRKKQVCVDVGVSKSVQGDESGNG